MKIMKRVRKKRVGSGLSETVGDLLTHFLALKESPIPFTIGGLSFVQFKQTINHFLRKKNKQPPINLNRKSLNYFIIYIYKMVIP